MKGILKLSVLLLVFISYASSRAISQTTNVTPIKKLTKKLYDNELGRSVAVSGDIMAVGSEDTVYIYYRNSGGTNNWGFIKKLTSGYNDFNFGWSVAISGDIIVVGSPWDRYDSAGGNTVYAAGAAYVFHRNSGGINNWGLVKKLTGKGSINDRKPNDYFGTSVSVSGDVIVVGAPGQNFDSVGKNDVFNVGAAYIFYRNSGGGSNWGFVKKLTGKGTNGRVYDDEFGNSVSISGDVIVVGAHQQHFDSIGNNNISDAGAAYVFYRNSGGASNWGFVKKLSGTGTNGRDIDDDFGYSVSISGDVIAIGAEDHDYDGVGSYKKFNAGAVFVFQRNSGGIDNWGSVKKLAIRPSSTSEYLGCSVSVSDGIIVAGSWGYGYSSNGAAYVFNRNSGGTDNWGLVKKILGFGPNSNNTFDKLGYSVSVSRDVIVAGAIGQSYDSTGVYNGMDAGAAYVFHANGICDTTSSISPATCYSYASPSGKHTWTTTGVYKDTLITAKGCDSIITVNLTINNTSTSSISPVSCYTYQSPSGKYTWTASGTYYDTISNANGCDSIVTINLTVNSSTTSSISTVSCNTYQSPSSKHTWITSGTYYDTIPNANGCDSIITVNLTIKNTSTSNVSSVSCNTYNSPSGKYTWTTSGTYYDTIPNVNGCDSVITISLTINSSTTSSIFPTACYSYTSPSGKYIWTSSGNYIDTLINTKGCDSLVTISLTINSVNTNVSVSGAEITSLASQASYKWLDCGNNYSILSGETSQIFNATVNGTYAVEVTQNSCVDTSACYNITNVNVSETTQENMLSVYPNPTPGKVSIIFDKPVNDAILIITSVTGQMVLKQLWKSGEKMQINLADYRQGIYYLKVQLSNKTYRKVLLKTN